MRAIDRSPLISLSVEHVNKALTETSPKWPTSLSIALEYVGGPNATLPLERGSYQHEALADLVPELMQHLNRSSPVRDVVVRTDQKSTADKNK